MRIDGITIFRLANDRLVEGWTNEDLLGMLRYQARSGTQSGGTPSTYCF
jgi:hypothetical protein